MHRQSRTMFNITGSGWSLKPKTLSPGLHLIPPHCLINQKIWLKKSFLFNGLSWLLERRISSLTMLKMMSSPTLALMLPVPCELFSFRVLADDRETHEQESFIPFQKISLISPLHFDYLETNELGVNIFGSSVSRLFTWLSQLRTLLVKSTSRFLEIL